ncbi:hypothetical protein ACPPVO_27020 [Dactylosporangium sp. McL0621]|uniref:hypothetical protein n=1 Tax=Dactylosporangium sp. McL0621 TaxID=3415678 RepID=UPI003CFB83F5
MDLVRQMEVAFERFGRQPVDLRQRVRNNIVTGAEFELVLAVPISGEDARVSLDQLNYDASTGTCFGFVEADRNKSSVALGIVGAVSWHQIAGGDLSGTGLNGERLSVERSGELLENLFSALGGEDIFGVVAQRLGCGPFE